MNTPSLTILPQGELGPWTFRDGSSCGKAEDSIGIDRPDTWNGRLRFFGLALTREDAVLLRQFIQTCEDRWAAQGWAFDGSRTTEDEAAKELEEMEARL